MHCEKITVHINCHEWDCIVLNFNREFTYALLLSKIKNHYN